jgi:hypothetical protein
MQKNMQDYGRRVLMSISLMTKVFKSNTTKGRHRLVLLSLADNASDEGVCWPSQSTTAKKCNLSRVLVNKTIGDLIEMGEIEILTETHKGYSPQVLTYLVHPKSSIEKNEPVKTGKHVNTGIQPPVKTGLHVPVKMGLHKSSLEPSKETSISATKVADTNTDTSTNKKQCAGVFSFEGESDVIPEKPLTVKPKGRRGGGRVLQGEANVIFKEETTHYPTKPQENLLYNANITNLTLWRETVRFVATKGTNPLNADYMLEIYNKGGPGVIKKNGNGYHNTQPIKEPVAAEEY